MNSEISSLDKDSAAYARHDQKYEVLVKDVKGLQGQLADLNIILDKVRRRSSKAPTQTDADCRDRSLLTCLVLSYAYRDVTHTPRGGEP